MADSTRQSRIQAMFRELIGADGRAPEPSRQRELLAQARAQGAETVGQLDELMLREVRRLARGLDDARQRMDELAAIHARLTAPPHYPAIVLGVDQSVEGHRLMVAHAGGLRSVEVAPELDGHGLAAGDEVLLGNQLNVVVGIPTCRTWRAGETAPFDRYTGDGRLVLKWRDEEIVIDPSRTLAEAPLRAGDRVRWDRNLFFGFERLERAQGEHLFLHESPPETFEAIGGLDVQIAELQRAVRLHFDHADQVRRYGLRRKGSVLLAGPPGTGKTLTARALANWLGGLSRAGRSRFINVKPGGLHSMWYAQSEANYREAFRVAREAGDQEPEVPVVMFFDEVDAIGGARGRSLHGVDDRVLTAFMTELDGLESRGNILVVAATNRRDALDPALLRPGRLGDLVLEVPRPGRHAARAIFAKHLAEAVPCAPAPEGGTRAELIDAAVSRMYAPNGLGVLATITLRDGRQRPVGPGDLVSGALIAQIAQRALERACLRELDTGQAGVRLSDLMAAIDAAFSDASATLTPANCRRHVDGLPQDVDVVRVEPAAPPARAGRRYRTLQVA